VPPLALALVLIAAMFHTGWNLAVKQAKQKQVFLWWALVVGSLCFSVFIFANPPLPARAWPYVISSALMEALYFIALTRAYSIDDFSLVYPLARGTAPILLVVWSTLFLGEPPALIGLLGIFLLAVGLIVVGSGSLWTRRALIALSPGSSVSVRTPVQRFSFAGIVAALVTALCISIYTAIDGAAARFVMPLPYTVWILGLSTIFSAPVVIVRYGVPAMLGEWRFNWWRIVVVGFAALFAYALVLQAYTMAHVSYAGSVREVSIVFAALIGWRFLGEGFGVARIVGSLLIFLGIIIIAVLG
jgi:drug/metabolite transporter (DMT)-like permease